MTEVKHIFGRRLRMARQKEQLSMEELSRQTGGAVSKQTISKYESGKAMAGSLILEKLADALDVSIEYFFRPFTFDMSGANISFRKKSNIKTKDISALISKVQDKVERYLEIEKILSIESVCSTPEMLPTITSALQMKELAKATRTKWGIGNSPIENAHELLIHHGVKVFEIEGPEGFDGVSGTVNSNIWVIVLNKKQKHVERKRLTLFHEYAHLLANELFSEDLSQSEKEKLCNVYASEMLLPSQVLMDNFVAKQKISFRELTFFQRTFGISVDAIMYSLKSSSLISDKRYRYFCILKNSNTKFKSAVEKCRFSEKQSSEYSISDTYTNMVYSALAQELITQGRAAEFLNVSISEIQSQSFVF